MANDPVVNLRGAELPTLLAQGARLIELARSLHRSEPQPGAEERLRAEYEAWFTRALTHCGPEDRERLHVLRRGVPMLTRTRRHVDGYLARPHRRSFTGGIYYSPEEDFVEPVQEQLSVLELAGAASPASPVEVVRATLADLPVELLDVGDAAGLRAVISWALRPRFERLREVEIRPGRAVLRDDSGGFAITADTLHAPGGEAAILADQVEDLTTTAVETELTDLVLVVLDRDGVWDDDRRIAALQTELFYERTLRTHPLVLRRQRSAPQPIHVGRTSSSP